MRKGSKFLNMSTTGNIFTGVCISLFIALLIYLPLFIYETYLFTTQPRPKAGSLEFQDLYKHEDSELGYSMTANWHRYVDYGPFVTYIDINEFGYRTKNFDSTCNEKILLLGDSMTFGLYINQEQTIPSEINKLRGNSCVFNAGVPGYGLPQIVANLEHLSWLKPTHIFYLFYENDLRDSELSSAKGRYAIMNGFLLPKSDNPQEQLKTMEASLFEPSNLTYTGSFTSILKLLRLRVNFFLARPLGKFGDPDYLINATIGNDFNEKTIPKAMHYSRLLQKTAAGLGSKFEIFIFPTIIEAMEKRYSKFSRAYLDDLKTTSIPIIESIDVLKRADFHDEGHLNSVGSKTVAKILNQRIQPLK